MAKTGVISLYLNSEDYAEVKRLADYHRISVNEWVKSRILAILHKQRDMPPNTTE